VLQWRRDGRLQHGRRAANITTGLGLAEAELQDHFTSEPAPAL